MTGLEILAVAPSAQGAANPLPDRSPVNGGKKENNFSIQFKRYFSERTLAEEETETLSPDEAIAAELPQNNNGEPEYPAAPAGEVPWGNKASPSLRLIEHAAGGINPGTGSMEEAEGKNQAPISENLPLSAGAPAQIGMRADSPMKIALANEGLSAEAVKAPPDGKILYSPDEMAQGRAETGISAAEEKLSAGEESIPAQMETMTAGKGKRPQKPPDFAHSLRNTASPAPERQLNSAEPGSPPFRADGAEEIPDNERRQTGEAEKAKTAVKYGKQSDYGKSNNLMPFTYTGTEESLKTARDPAALALWLNKTQAKEVRRGQEQAEPEKEPGAEKETAGGKPGKQAAPFKGEADSLRIAEETVKGQSDIAKGLKLPEDKETPLLRTDRPEKEPVEEAKQPEIGKNTPGYRAEPILSENSPRDSAKPIPERNWVDPERFMEQIVKKAEAMIKQNLSQIRIQLHPEFLGKMTIKLVLEDGLLTARFITESQQVKHLLDSNLNQLRHNLESQGIKVEKTEVNVQLNNGGLFDGSEGSRQDLWERPRYFSHYHAEKAGDDAYLASTVLNEPEAGIIKAEENYLLAADGSMDFLI